MHLPQVIYVMGPPGAGKGTQSQLLADKIKYDRFGTGDAMRDLSNEDTPLGHEVKALVDNGLFAPPSLAAKIVIAAISDHLKDGKGIIFDGSPRTEEEAVIIDKFFIDEGYGQPLVIALDIDRAEMERRNSIRRFCLGIHPSFAIIHPADEKHCLEVGGTIGKRADDDPAKFEARWQQYIDRAYPVIKEYLLKGMGKQIDGKRSIEEVHREVMDFINEYST